MVTILVEDKFEEIIYQLSVPVNPVSRVTKSLFE